MRKEGDQTFRESRMQPPKGGSREGKKLGTNSSAPDKVKARGSLNHREKRYYKGKARLWGGRNRIAPLQIGEMRRQRKENTGGVGGPSAFSKRAELPEGGV